MVAKDNMHAHTLSSPQPSDNEMMKSSGHDQAMLGQSSPVAGGAQGKSIAGKRSLHASLHRAI